LQALIQLGIARDLRLHKFKRTMNLARVRKVLGILRGLQPSDMLDIGSGRGAFLWPLLDAFPGLPVTAVDLLDRRVADIEAVRRGSA
jgi:2-polyprenyl-3-methyl-5-hydroxy-6-metoxy-1,4-benzoquinol methylase